MIISRYFCGSFMEKKVSWKVTRFQNETAPNTLNSSWWRSDFFMCAAHLQIANWGGELSETYSSVTIPIVADDAPLYTDRIMDGKTDDTRPNTLIEKLRTAGFTRTSHTSSLTALRTSDMENDKAFQWRGREIQHRADDECFCKVGSIDSNLLQC